MNRRKFISSAAGGLAIGSGAVPLLTYTPLSAYAEGDIAKPSRQPDVHYVPTPMEAVDKMLEMAEVKKSDLVYDLGSGDGRIIIRAAEKIGSRGIGIDIDPARIAEANTNAKKSKVTNLVKFEVGDVFATDFSTASVVTLYLLPSLNMKLRPKIQQALKPGTRVVSHAFDMGDWQPKRTERVGNSTLYLWVV
jgi:SAM-dependent methyltransferase